MRRFDQAVRAAEIEAAVINETVLALIDEGNLTGDDLLRADLERCIAAPALIPAEQARLQEEIDRESNPIRRELLAWQRDHVEAYILWAARNATARLCYLDALDTAELQTAERERCQSDLLHWFRAWAWSLDPRMTALPVVPFVPFKFQSRTLTRLDNLIRVRRSSALVEKARDQGASWMAVLLSVYYWLYLDYSQILFGSYKEELVDSKQNLDTLLEKVRFSLRRLPGWMMPAAFSLKRDMGYMSIPNPSTGALISGAAPTENFARAGRYTVIWLDELAAYRFGGYPQWTASSQSAQSRIPIFTPRGKANQAADLRFSGTMEVISLKWQQHPWKDQRWREGQSLTMSEQQIAQEIEINYEASQPGRIYPMWHEAYHVITWSEFEAVYGVRHIPPRWLLGRLQDVGTSPGHEPTTDWFAKPPEGDKLWDTVFWYRSWVAPVDWDVGTIAEGLWGPGHKLITPGIWQREKERKEADRMNFSDISWEGESERRSYEKCTRYPINFSRIKKPGFNEGIAQARTLLTLQPEPHPFTRHPLTLEPLFGRPRAILIVDDDQAQLLVDQDGFLSRTPATAPDDGTINSLMNPRFEFPQYHNKLQTEPGKPNLVLRPYKKNDNSMDNFRYAARRWGPSNAEMTRRERIESKLPDQVKAVNLPTPEQALTMPEGEYSALTVARLRAIAKAEKEIDTAADPRKRRERTRTRKPARRQKR